MTNKARWVVMVLVAVFFVILATLSSTFSPGVSPPEVVTQAPVTSASSDRAAQHPSNEVVQRVPANLGGADSCRIAVAGHQGDPIAGAVAYHCDLKARTVAPDSRLACSDHHGDMTIRLSQVARNPRSGILLAADGFIQRSIAASALIDGMVVVMQPAIQLTVVVSEVGAPGGTPVHNAKVVVSYGDVRLAECPDSCVPGPIDGIHVSLTAADGRASFGLGRSGRWQAMVTKDGYVAVQGCPFAVQVGGDTTVRVDLAPLYGAIVEIANDSLLDYSFAIPPCLRTGARIVRELSRLGDRARASRPNTVAVLGVLPDGYSFSGRETLDIKVFTSQRGLGTVTVPLRRLGADGYIERVSLSSLPCESGQVVLTLGDQPSSNSSSPSLFMKLIPANAGVGSTDAGARAEMGGNVEIGRPVNLPSGTYKLISREVVVNASIADECRIVHVVSGQLIEHRVGFARRLRPVQFRFVSADETPILNAHVKIERILEPAGGQAARVVRGAIDLEEAVFWLEVGSWRVQVTPPSGASRECGFDVADGPLTTCVTVKG